ncbi:phosphate/phosphite/phosphonate ABC transporter substrate-binding protein, partial [Bacillus cereus]|nr:phosphate/phosphite/phosphonate ABC transporter substrate-binding protein [Bacillus cereus]
MFKKALTLCMTFTLAAGLAACGSNANNNNSASTPRTDGSKTESTAYVPKELKVQFVPSQNADTLEAKAKP